MILVGIPYIESGIFFIVVSVKNVMYRFGMLFGYRGAQ